MSMGLTSYTSTAVRRPIIATPASLVLEFLGILRPMRPVDLGLGWVALATASRTSGCHDHEQRAVGNAAKGLCRAPVGAIESMIRQGGVVEI